MASSYWHGGAREVEVLVIGAGIAGVGAGLELARRGVDFNILERGRPACGASGRNAGFLMRGAADNYALACRQWGRERARELWRWSEDNLRLLRESGAAGATGFEDRPSCILALDEAEAAELRESVELMAADGFEVDWLEQHDDDAWASGRVLGGLVNPHDAVCHPIELVRHLARPIEERIATGCEVLELRLDDGAIEASTRDGLWRAQRVLLCTNAYAPGLAPQLAGLITPRRGQMLALDAPDVRVDFAYYANRGHEYVRAGPGGRVLVGGCRKLFAESEVGEDDRACEPVQGALEGFAGEFFGRSLPVCARWAGIMGFSATGLPLVGAIPGWDDRLWCCCGFTGHGMSLGFKTAKAAAEEMLGGEATPFALAGARGAR